MHTLRFADDVALITANNLLRVYNQNHGWVIKPRPTFENKGILCEKNCM